MTYLANIFRKLANNPNWPSWQRDMARLAMMVVELMKGHYLGEHDFSVGMHKKAEASALKEWDIDPEHYANVKERVKGANNP